MDGAYRTASGPMMWLSFSGDEYLAWSSDSTCSDPSTAPASCAEHGQFSVDRANKLLTLTSDAGRVSSHALEIRATADATTTQSLRPATMLVPGDPLLKEQEPLVAQDFELGDPSSQEANLFKKVAVVCRVIGLLTQPVPGPVIVPPVPPPIERQQCAKS
jgi:hypothetical protein